MSVATDIQALANAHSTGAHEALDSLIALGPRPTAPPAAAQQWDQSKEDLQKKIDDLTASAIKLSAQAVVTALADSEDALTGLKAAADQAAARIKQIKDLSNLLTTLAAVVDVGVAVLALAAAPSVTTGKAVVDKIQALAKATSGQDGDKTAAKPKSK